MRTRQRPVSQQSAKPQTRSAATRPARKIFNCIVDDSALVAGVKRSTRNGIRQWVKNGQIRLFVPLHALDELNRQKNGTTKHAEDVRETLQWLDDATDKSPDAVAVQGPEDTYEKWALVEQFVVPRTLFSEDNHDHEVELVELSSVSYGTASKLNVTDENAKASMSSGATEASRSLSPSSMRSPHSSSSALSPPASPQKKSLPPAKTVASLNAAASRPQSLSASVPASLQPLFNYILWRIHQELDPVAALESFIFLCNDARKVGFAKGFDIKTKRLEQLREAVGREDRDSKNRQALINRESQSNEHEESTGQKSEELKKEIRPITPKDAVDEQNDEVVFKPPKAPAAMLQKPGPSVMDPNAFGRGPPAQQAIKQEQPKASRSPRIGGMPAHGGSPRGSHMLPFSPRGNVRGGRGNIRGNARGRGNGTARGGGPTNVNEKPAAAAAPPSPREQIDPASFTRPEAPRQQRKLWVPT
ncbi:hypothetical protein Slin15195_G012840 [Septoria linicola]|uniref:PIN domain-containing protein n=1 Tax=Septoria linicola TaxID=215465 RepID=A0A9Q9AK87_9PEZI|nr:hypothetical protein Slin14017_G012870 [Septoria linicola]USW47965.1 hypothetical protein Slin15195_G012840 [Septoria linicola]